MIDINVEEAVEFLVGLLNTHSPTGDTDRAIAYVADAFAPFPFEMKKSPKGFLSGTWAGRQSGHGRALTAHVDTLGGMVQKIKDNGRLQLTQLGGWVWNSVEGEGVTIYAASDETYRGSFMPTTASIHAHTREESYAKRKADNMEVRIDAETNSDSDTKGLGIRVGDIVAFDPRVEVTDSGYIRSRHLDDKASVACLYAAVRAMTAAGLQPVRPTTFHISNYEEVGHGAATGFPDDLAELVAVDMAVVAPDQESNEHKVTICAKDAGGPYHLGLRRRLQALAEENEIDHCVDIYPYYGSDGEAYWHAGGNTAVGLIGPGVDASHHYERTHRDAIRHTAALIVAYLTTE